jgi:formate dehydrogenase major subunit
MNDAITFTIDGKTVHATGDETIWQVANRTGLTIPHLCYSPEPDYRADGNCRACMVEIEGERCCRPPACGSRPKARRERAVEGGAPHGVRVAAGGPTAAGGCA